MSVVVTTPSVVTLRRSQAIFGAEKYGSSTSPVRAASMSACSASSGVTVGGAPVLPHDRRGQRRGRCRAVPGQDRLALVGQGDRADRTPGLGERLASRRQNRVEERLRILFDAAVRQVLRVEGHLGLRDDTVDGVGHDRLRT